VTVKDPDNKSNYRAYLAGHVTEGLRELDARIAIGYKSSEAAKKVKSSETITLILTLANGVKPVEIKVSVKNVR
jgi:hypothetical protein